MSSAATIPTDDAVLSALSDLRLTQPELGIKKLHERLKSSEYCWTISVDVCLAQLYLRYLFLTSSLLATSKIEFSMLCCPSDFCDRRKGRQRSRGIRYQAHLPLYLYYSRISFDYSTARLNRRSYPSSFCYSFKSVLLLDRLWTRSNRSGADISVERVSLDG